MLSPLLGHIVGLREGKSHFRYNRTCVRSNVPGSGSGGSVINWPPGSGSVKKFEITILSKTERNFYKKVTTYGTEPKYRIRIHNLGLRIRGTESVRNNYGSRTPQKWYAIE
jgi:hypothetical protein